MKIFLFLLDSLSGEPFRPYRNICSILPCDHFREPVCGTDMRTYDNLCQLQQANCERSFDKIVGVLYEGECPKDCNSICPNEWNPVCATNGKTYSNECMLANARCESNDRRLKINYYGECTNQCPNCINSGLSKHLAVLNS